jgi:16S rRNA (cytosine1402-N4)-methyltransferase
VDHQPVLAGAVVDVLRPALEGGGIFVDATLGGAGHALRLLEAAPAAELVGIDRDPEALEASRLQLDAHRHRVRLVHDDFARLAAVLERLGIASVRGVLLDLGVSSPQLDVARRGFSFRHDGPLDMRMDPAQRLTAHEVVNEYTVEELTRVIRGYGEERFAARIARAIERARPVESTAALAEVVRGAIPAPARRTGGHPARRTFQALRIEVNDELGALDAVLPAAVDALEAGGRVAAISYHSLEDRRVKKFFNDEANGCVCPPDFPVCTCGAEARLRILTRRPVRPPAAEIAENRRASAARLRAAERVLAESEPVPEDRRQSA